MCRSQESPFASGSLGCPTRAEWRSCIHQIYHSIYHTIFSITPYDPDGEYGISTIDVVQSTPEYSLLRTEKMITNPPSSRQHKSNNNSSPTARANHNGPRRRIAFLGSCAIVVLDYIRSHVFPVVTVLVVRSSTA